MDAQPAARMLRMHWCIAGEAGLAARCRQPRNRATVLGAKAELP
jgi:hypothetical protein